MLSEQAIYLADLQRLNHRAVLMSKAKSIQPDQTLLKGFLYQSGNDEGLSVHAGHVLELQDRTSFVELSPAISITILFKGRVGFTLGNQHYQLGNYADEAVECSAFILNRPEMLGRQFKTGEQIHKLNLFIERKWLFKRSKTAVTRQRFDQLFEQHGAFHYWKADAELVTLARTLFDACQTSTLARELLKESLALQVIAKTLDTLLTLSKPAHTEPMSEKLAARDDGKSLRQQIDTLITAGLTLAEMANEVGMSVSTLQRRFKSCFGITVNSYCLNRRLQMAKMALLVDRKSIGEAAYIAGYHHASNFITAFKKHFGMTPSDLVKANP